MAVKGHDVIAAVPTAVHARSWKHPKLTNAAEWSEIVAAAAEWTTRMDACSQRW